MPIGTAMMGVAAVAGLAKGAAGVTRSIMDSREARREEDLADRVEMEQWRGDADMRRFGMGVGHSSTMQAQGGGNANMTGAMNMGIQGMIGQQQPMDSLTGPMDMLNRRRSF